MRRSGYVHEAALYDGDAGFVEALVPFVRDGLEADEPVLAVVPGSKIGVLRDGLGADAVHIEVADMAVVGRNPACILSVWERFIAAHPRRALRGIGEPSFAGRSADELDECFRHEAALNVAIDPAVPLWLLCTYDTAALDPGTVGHARTTHPHLRDDGGVTASPDYDAVAVAGAVLDGVTPDAPTADVESMLVGGEMIAAARHFVADHARGVGFAGDRLGDVVLVVSELVTNSVRHGGGAGELSVWLEHGALVCRVRDRGWIRAPDAGRHLPSATAPNGRGLWLANQLSDLLQVRSTAGSTCITARWRLPSAG